MNIDEPHPDIRVRDFKAKVAYLLRHSKPPTSTTIPTNTATATMMKRDEAAKEKSQCLDLLFVLFLF